MNIFEKIHHDALVESIDSLVSTDKLRIERICSNGHTTPAGQWYDQAQDEWVVVLKGEGVLSFEDGSETKLGPGDHLTIPAHRKHRVSHTAPDTLWLAVHFTA